MQITNSTIHVQLRNHIIPICLGISQMDRILEKIPHLYADQIWILLQGSHNIKTEAAIRCQFYPIIGDKIRLDCIMHENEDLNEILRCISKIVATDHLSYYNYHIDTGNLLQSIAGVYAMGLYQHDANFHPVMNNLLLPILGSTDVPQPFQVELLQFIDQHPAAIQKNYFEFCSGVKGEDPEFYQAKHPEKVYSRLHYRFIDPLMKRGWIEATDRYRYRLTKAGKQILFLFQSQIPAKGGH